MGTFLEKRTWPSGEKVNRTVPVANKNEPSETSPWLTEKFPLLEGIFLCGEELNYLCRNKLKNEKVY